MTTTAKPITNGPSYTTRSDVTIRPAVRRFFTTVMAAHRVPGEVIADRVPSLANVIEERLPAAFHNPGQYEN